MRKSGEAKYAHLSNDLHVLIEVFAPPGEAYSRMSHALEEIKKFLVPVSLILPIFITRESKVSLECSLHRFSIRLDNMKRGCVRSQHHVSQFQSENEPLHHLTHHHK